MAKRFGELAVCGIQAHQVEIRFLFQRLAFDSGARPDQAAPHVFERQQIAAQAAQGVEVPAGQHVALLPRPLVVVSRQKIAAIQRHGLLAQFDPPARVRAFVRRIQQGDKIVDIRCERGRLEGNVVAPGLQHGSGCHAQRFQQMPQMVQGNAKAVAADVRVLVGPERFDQLVTREGTRPLPRQKRQQGHHFALAEAGVYVVAAAQCDPAQHFCPPGRFQHRLSSEPAAKWLRVTANKSRFTPLCFPCIPYKPCEPRSMTRIVCISLYVIRDAPYSSCSSVYGCRFYAPFFSFLGGAYSSVIRWWG